MADLDPEAIKTRKLTWTPYRVDDAGNAWEWEGRAESTRILVDPATHAYLVDVAIDIDALVAEVERLDDVLLALVAVLEEVGHLQLTLAEARDPDRPYRPFGKLDPEDPVDQAFVRAFNRGARKGEPRCRICGYDEHVAHHLTSGVKGYHPFVPATDTKEQKG